MSGGVLNKMEGNEGVAIRRVKATEFTAGVAIRSTIESNATDIMKY